MSDRSGAGIVGDILGALYTSTCDDDCYHHHGMGGLTAAGGGGAMATPNRENTERIRQVEERLDQLTLVCAAMWQLMRERTNLTEQDLAERMAVIDAKDGVADGKMTHTINKCPKCNRTMSPKHKRCLYCGFQKPIETVFDTM